MLDILVVIILVALVGSSIFQYLNNRSTNRQLQEYKDLFEVADLLQKEAQAKVEGLFQDIGRKDLLLDRSAQTVEQATAKERQQTEEISGLKSQVSFQEEQYAKLFNQKKSSEVRLGQISEQIAPFLVNYPLDPKDAKFIGDPIDIVSFGPDKITFVEVKSGKSQLNKRQREVRDLIKAGKVEFIIYRVEGKV